MSNRLIESSKRAGRPSELEALMAEPQRYKEFIAYVEIGVTYVAAAASIGISPETLAGWLRKGRENDDSIYSKFLADIRQAVGKASIVVEGEIRADDPKFWLRNGPRRLLGDDWRDDPDIKNMPVNTDNSTHLTYINTNDIDVSSALKELLSAGITMDDSVDNNLSSHDHADVNPTHYLPDNLLTHDDNMTVNGRVVNDDRHTNDDSASWQDRIKRLTRTTRGRKWNRDRHEDSPYTTTVDPNLPSANLSTRDVDNDPSFSTDNGMSLDEDLGPVRHTRTSKLGFLTD